MIGHNAARPANLMGCSSLEQERSATRVLPPAGCKRDTRSTTEAFQAKRLSVDFSIQVHHEADTRNGQTVQGLIVRHEQINSGCGCGCQMDCVRLTNAHSRTNDAVTIRRLCVEWKQLDLVAVEEVLDGFDSIQIVSLARPRQDLREGKQTAEETVSSPEKTVM